MNTARHRDGIKDLARRAVTIGMSRDQFLLGEKDEHKEEMNDAFDEAIQDAWKKLRTE